MARDESKAALCHTIFILELCEFDNNVCECKQVGHNALGDCQKSGIISFKNLRKREGKMLQFKVDMQLLGGEILQMVA